MAEENISFETLLSKFILTQSKLEYETNALENLISAARSRAENDNSDLIYIIDALNDKAQALKNIVFEMKEG